MSGKRYTEEFKVEAADREAARREVFDYIEMFYNPKRRHGHSNHLCGEGISDDS